MDSIALQLKQLRSRIKPCEELKVAPNLPLEGITALEQACDDPAFVVAWTTSHVLLAHRQIGNRPNTTPEPSDLTSDPIRTSVTTQNILLWLLILGAFFAFFGVPGSPVELRCTRVESHGPVNCFKQTRVLGIIPLPQQRVDDVRHALVGESVDAWEGDTGYRVELLTAGGMVPLRNVYISDFSSKAAKDEVAGQINDFVQSMGPGTFVVTEPGLLSSDNIFCSLVWFLIAAAGSYLWGKIKSWFGRA